MFEMQYFGYYSDRYFLIFITVISLISKLFRNWSPINTFASDFVISLYFLVSRIIFDWSGVTSTPRHLLWVTSCRQCSRCLKILCVPRLLGVRSGAELVYCVFQISYIFLIFLVCAPHQLPSQVGWQSLGWITFLQSCQFLLYISSASVLFWLEFSKYIFSFQSFSNLTF